jgi:hypothetical protein
MLIDAATMRTTRAALLLTLALAGCHAVPPLRVPQVEHATEAVQSGGERYRAHRACSNAVPSVDRMIGCMRDAGWDFITRGPGYPEAGCWQARDRGEVEHLPEICFVRHAEPRPGAAP